MRGNVYWSVAVIGGLFTAALYAVYEQGRRDGTRSLADSSTQDKSTDMPSLSVTPCEDCPENPAQTDNPVRSAEG